MNYTFPRFVDTTVLLARIYEASIWQVMPVDFWDTPQMRTKALLLNSILMLGITFSNLYDSLFVPFIFTIEFMLPFFDIDILHPDRTLPTFFVNNMCDHHFYNTNVMRSEFNEKKKQSWMFIEHTHSWIHSLHTIWLSNNSFGTPLSQHFTDVYHIFSIPVNMPIGNQMSWPNSCTHLEEPTLVCLSAMQYAPILLYKFQAFSDRKETEQTDFLIFRTTHLIFIQFILDDISGTPSSFPVSKCFLLFPAQLLLSSRYP